MDLYFAVVVSRVIDVTIRFSHSTDVWAEFDCGIRVGYHIQRYLRIVVSTPFVQFQCLQRLA